MAGPYTFEWVGKVVKPTEKYRHSPRKDFKSTFVFGEGGLGNPETLLDTVVHSFSYTDIPLTDLNPIQFCIG